MKANLSGTVLRGADLRKANLCDANLRGADLSEARRKKPVVEDVKIPTDLREADLRGADLSGAKLEGAQFDGAKVAGAKLTGAALGNNPTGQVDCSSAGDGSQMRSIQAWLNSTLPV
jgi:uncharacterized protein YjbI with pentapeptide repeats